MPVQVGWPGTGVIAVNQNAGSSHPAVAQCAVIGVPDPEWGERVHAVVVLRPGPALTAEDLREHVKALIAGYKAPRSLEITDALPVSRAGKILKRELRAQALGGHDRGVSQSPTSWLRQCQP